MTHFYIAIVNAYGEPEWYWHGTRLEWVAYRADATVYGPNRDAIDQALSKARNTEPYHGAVYDRDWCNRVRLLQKTEHGLQDVNERARVKAECLGRAPVRAEPDYTRAAAICSITAMTLRAEEILSGVLSGPDVARTRRDEQITSARSEIRDAIRALTALMPR